MSLINVSLLVLASMVAVLAGMVGYMYWQQNRVLHIVNSLTSYVSNQFVKSDESDDDRLSVQPDNDSEEVEVVQKVEVPVVEDYESKTSAELKEILSSKGLPYGKRASKAELLKLVKESL